MTVQAPIGIAAQTPKLVALAGPTTSAEIEVARQALERIFQNGSSATLTGAGVGTSASATAGSRAVGVLVQGLGLAVSTFSIWNALAKPAGIPALEETLMVNGVEGFFDRLHQMTADEGGNPQAVDALESTVMGFLEQGRVHSAGVILGETFAKLQEGGLISEGRNPVELGMSTALRYAQQNPSVLQTNLVPATPANRPDTVVAPALPSAPQTPALTAELQSLRDDIKRGDFANSAADLDAGQSELNALVNRSNGFIERGEPTINQSQIDVAQTELTFRRYDSVLSQYDRNAISGGPLPNAEDFTSYMEAIRDFDADVESQYKIEGFDDASLNVVENRVNAAIGLRADFGQFMDQATSGQFANSAESYADGVAQLESLRLESNGLQSTQGITGIDQSGYDNAVLQLEGRRANSMLAQTLRDIDAGRTVDINQFGALVERAQSIDSAFAAQFGEPLFAGGGVGVYRDALNNLQASLNEQHAAEVAGEVELETLPDPILLPGGNDLTRVGQEYGVSPHDIARVMEQNPGMSAEQAAQYIKGLLLSSPTGGNAANPPLPPSNGTGSTATGTGDADGSDSPRQLEAQDLGFATREDPNGTTVVINDYVGPNADVARAADAADGYELTDSYDMQTGQYTIQIRSSQTGEVLGEVQNARLANAGDRFAAVVEFNADKLFGDNQAVRNNYIQTWRNVIRMVMEPGNLEHNKLPNRAGAEGLSRLLEAQQNERIRTDREGAGVELILPEGSLPEAQGIPGVTFEPPGQAPSMP
ncbi:MAG: hypothetical protein AB8G17_07520 [Gammaproteobacteria bacterium]